MCAGYASLINGGNYYQPHLVKRVETAEGEIVKTYDSKLVKQTVTEETSAIINKYLRAVVEEGTGGLVKIAGYDIGGKTGTAQKIPRTDRKWVISFIGAVPMDNPKYIVYVVLDEPFGTTGAEGASNDAKQLFRNILLELLPYMGIYKDAQDVDNNTNKDMNDAGVEVPDVNAPDNGSEESETQSGVTTQPSETTTQTETTTAASQAATVQPTN